MANERIDNYNNYYYYYYMFDVVFIYLFQNVLPQFKKLLKTIHL